MKTDKFTPNSEEAYTEFPDIKYYQSGADRTYFDATFYLQQNDTSFKRSVDGFLSEYKHQISALCEALGLVNLEIAIMNEETGNVMLFEALEFLFIKYIDVWYCKYEYERLRELHSLGFTVSDPYLAGLHKHRFETDVK